EGENNEENDEYVDEAVDKDGNDSGNDLDDDDPFSGDDDSFPIDDSQMITIPAGTFSMGCNNAVDSECAADEVPYHEITVSEFRIDKFEVTVSSFRKCITAGSCNNADSQKPHFNTTTSDESCNLGANDKEMHPMNCVSWYGAKAYCEWLGKRLPTEAEWEKAARGDDGRKYPWGNSGLSCDNAVIYDGCGTGTTMVVGSKPGGASPYGVEDMVGNVWEWVNDWYDEYYYTATSNEDPIGPESGTYKVLRGGAWMDSYDKTSDRRTSVRSKHYPNLRQSARGFRCAK
ncbi:MAG TPA: formylglycine-generating enzyme family protein, partial [bacterium]|nr:formylglycine-generating enzyme family protein [bacterium]